MMYSFYPMVSLVLLATCAISANAAVQSRRSHRHLRHQLISKVVRHVHRAHLEEEESAVEEDGQRPCQHGDQSVPSGWSGKGIDDNDCNHCTCTDGMLVCTQTACDQLVRQDDLMADESPAPLPPAPAAPAANAAPCPPGMVPASLEAGDEDSDDDAEAEDAEDREYEAELAKLELNVTIARQALAENLHKQDMLRKRKYLLENPDESDKEIDAQTHLVANETESAAMAGMLGDMWKDIRMYAAPAYTKFLTEQLQKLQVEQKVLETKLSEAQAALAKKQAESSDEDEAPNVPAAITEGETPEVVKVVPEETAEASKTWQPWWAKYPFQAIAGGLVYVLFGVIFAYVYSQKRQSARFLKLYLEPKEGNWSVGLFDCCANRTMCVLGFCCPCVRWADTVDRARVGYSYWPAFALMFLLMVLNNYAYGLLTGLVAVVGVIYRQRLRAKYKLPKGSARTIAEDALAWFCCTPCAIVQEAYEEAANRDM